MTVAGIRVPIEQAGEFGVIEAGDDGRTIRAFREKPTDPTGLRRRARPGLRVDGQLRLQHATRSIDAVTADAPTRRSSHDIGGNIIPALVERGEAQVYDFTANDVPGATDRERGYWRDVGTLDAYYDAHMDLVSVDPVFNLYNREWPILTLARAAAAGQVRLRGRRAAPGTRSTRWCAPASIVSGGDGAPLDPVARTSHLHSYARSRARC